MSNSFYVLGPANETLGPYSLEQMRHMWRIGQVTRQTLFCQEGFADWLPLDSLEELRGPAAPSVPAWGAQPKINKKPPTMEESVAAGILRAVSVLGAISLIVGLLFFFLRAVM